MPTVQTICVVHLHCAREVCFYVLILLNVCLVQPLFSGNTPSFFSPPTTNGHDRNTTCFNPDENIPVGTCAFIYFYLFLVKTLLRNVCISYTWNQRSSCACFSKNIVLDHQHLLTRGMPHPSQFRCTTSPTTNHSVSNLVIAHSVHNPSPFPQPFVIILLSWSIYVLNLLIYLPTVFENTTLSFISHW